MIRLQFVGKGSQMRGNTREELRERADALGVARSFWNGRGDRHEVADGTLEAVLAAVDHGEPPDPRWPVVVVAQHGRRGWTPPDDEPVQVVLESGEERGRPDAWPDALPLGYHWVVGETGRSRLIVAPPRCHLPAALTAGGRAWGWAAQLYAVRSERSWGVGDLGDLATLMTDESVRGDFVLVNPLNAPRLPTHPGPYSPSSRLFRNPVYLCVERLPERTALDGMSRARFDELADAGRGLRERALIDREAVLRVKDEALRLCWTVRERLPTRSAGFEAWRRAKPTVEAFAVFRALQDDLGDDWRSWPAEHRHPTGATVDRCRAGREDEVSYHAWVQWLLEDQVRALPSVGIGLVNDLPLGVARSGFDAWFFQDQTATGVTIGAPPDDLAPEGQDWRSCAFAPATLVVRDRSPFVESVRAAMAGAGGLRIDHVMGLFRQFLIPDGTEPAQGTYVRYPSEDLLGILALESHRARALVIGEDLGTVGPGVRERLAAGHVLSSRLVWFERDPEEPSRPRRPADYPTLAMAALGTHDLPTVAGLFSGSDVREQHHLGVLTGERLAGAVEADDAQKHELLSLLRGEGLLDDGPVEVGSVIGALHAFLARTPSILIAARLEDALEVRRRPNVPGTSRRQRPRNWRRPLPVPLEDLADDPRVRRLVALLRSGVAVRDRRHA